MLFSNHIILVCALAWLSAQIIKSIINVIVNREFKLERLVGAGGMPSSHSAFVTALFVEIIQATGYNSPESAIAFAIALIAMYDAVGVRHAAGEHAKTLNSIIKKLVDEGVLNNDTNSNLKELLGHTPLQVAMGLLLGLFISLII